MKPVGNPNTGAAARINNKIAPDKPVVASKSTKAVVKPKETKPFE